MNLVYSDVHGKNVPRFYEGASTDVLRHTIRLSDSSKIAVHNSNLELLDQPNFSNIPITHLDYINEVGTRLTIEEANKLPLFVAFQFGQAHHRPWRTKGKNSGSIWRK